MDRKDQEQRELNQGELEKAAGGSVPTFDELDRMFACKTEGHCFEIYFSCQHAGKDYQVGKWRCTRCGDTGFFRSGNAAGSKIIPISEQEYRTYLIEYKAFVRGE